MKKSKIITAILACVMLAGCGNAAESSVTNTSSALTSTSTQMVSSTTFESETSSEVAPSETSMQVSLTTVSELTSDTLADEPEPASTSFFSVGKTIT